MHSDDHKKNEEYINHLLKRLQNLEEERVEQATRIHKLQTQLDSKVDKKFMHLLVNDH